MDSILIHVTDLLAVTASDDLLHNHTMRQMCALADKLNSALPEYEVMLAHPDADDYLMFTWQEHQQEEA